MAANGGKRRANTDYIVDDAARKAAFKKRQKGLIKKLSGITTLCGVRACAVIYNPDTEGQPDIFPANDPSAVANMITEFNSLPEVEQTLRMFSQEDFLAGRIKKADEQLQKLRLDNQEMRLSNTLFEYFSDSAKSFDDLRMLELYELAKVNETNFRQVNYQINTILAMTGSAAAPAVPDFMNQGNGLAPMSTINPFTFHQNMVGGEGGMVYPDFMNPGNGLIPMSTNETGFPACFTEMAHGSQNGGGSFSNFLNIGSSSDSPSM